MDSEKPTIEFWEYVNYGNGYKLVEHNIKELNCEWISEKNDPVYQSALKNISIGFFSPSYINVSEIQDENYEYKKIKKFLIKYLDNYSKTNNIPLENLRVEFINYGKTELVYVLNDKNSEKQITLLVKQPGVEFGTLQKEANNLIDLSKKHDNIVYPIDYYKLSDQELYVTPYYYQARCVASSGSWGIYIPEPYYRFESFTGDQEDIVTTCMIAKLVSLFDFNNNEGICSCKLGGGDFILLKQWENEELTIENTLNNLYLTAAREKFNCSFEEYLKIIRDEFARRTFTDNEENILVNHRGRVPIKSQNIEDGIKLAMSIINNKNFRIEEKEKVKTIKRK